MLPDDVVELKWLEDFVAVADTSSFSRAAEVRHVTQSALSRRIQRLEAWLGATLISRATLPMELTPAGQSFLPVAREAIHTMHTTRERLHPRAETGMLRFAALHTLVVTFFPSWLTQLKGGVDNVRTSMTPDRGGIEANLMALTDGEVDFFLTYAHHDVPFHLDGRQYRYLTVGRDRVIPVSVPELVIEGHRVPMAGLLDRPELDDWSIPYLDYGFSSFLGVALQRLFARQRAFKRHAVHENAICAGLKTLALRGAGLCWLPESLIRTELAEGLLVLAGGSGDWALDLDIRLYRSAEHDNPATRMFWEAACRQTPRPAAV